MSTPANDRIQALEDGLASITRPLKPAGRGWIVAVAAMVSAILPLMEFVQGYWQKDREMAIAQARHTHETQRVWIEMAVRQDLPEKAKRRVLRFLEASLEDEKMRRWAADELEIVEQTIEAAEKARDDAKREAEEAARRLEGALAEAKQALADKRALELKLAAATDASQAEIEARLAEARTTLAMAQSAVAASEVAEQTALNTVTGIDAKLASTAIPVTTTPGGALGAARPRVFMHIRAEEQRPRATEIAAALRRHGALVPGIERVQAGPSATELRYFRRDEREAVHAAARTARALGLVVEPRYIPGHEDSTAIRPMTFELWLAPEP